MGIVPYNAPLLFNEGRRRPFVGKVLQLGRQDIFFNREEYEEIAVLSGFSVRPEPLLPFVAARGQTKNVLSDIEFFRRLGFDEVFSLDFFDDGLPGSLVFDLNSDEPPPSSLGRYDFIFDGGTLEHLFHVPNALRNLHALLNPGGRVLHLNPASNMIEHGFYSFSPCFYEDYYEANGYKICDVRIFKITPGNVYEAWTLDLRPKSDLHRLNLMQEGSLGSATCNMCVVVEKTPESTAGKKPIQRFYRQPFPTIQEWMDADKIYPKENGHKILPWEPLLCRPTPINRPMT
jgi:SAM-dependent methyltransferase